jgi:hypothetical protein
MASETFALKTNNAGQGAINILNPAGLDDGGPTARYAAMSITRNPAGCCIPREDSIIRRRQVAGESLSFERDPIAVADIPGATRTQRFAHSRSTFHDTADISGAAPKPRHVARTGHHDIMAHDDIEGTRRRTTDLRSKREVDPLNPQYKLPSAPEQVPVTLPFKRELIMSVDDIAGTRSQTYLPWKPRESMQLNVRERVAGGGGNNAVWLRLTYVACARVRECDPIGNHARISLLYAGPVRDVLLPAHATSPQRHGSLVTCSSIPWTPRRFAALVRAGH